MNILYDLAILLLGTDSRETCANVHQVVQTRLLIALCFNRAILKVIHPTINSKIHKV